MRRRLNHWIGRLRRDVGGNVAVLFGLAAVPVLALVGGAVDYASANRDKAALQAAFDAAALAGSRQVSRGAPAARAEAEAIMRANLPERLRFVRAEIVVDGRRVSVANAVPYDMPTSLLRLVGIDTIPVRARAEAVHDGGAIDVALVVDASAGMAGPKLAETRRALAAFLSDVAEANGRGARIRVGLVPYDAFVNTGRGVLSTDQLDMTAFPPELRAAALSVWTGCVADRAQPHDTDDQPPVPGRTATLYPPALCDVAPLQPLTDDIARVGQRVEAMRPAGATNITIGLAWGHHMLSRTAPLTEAQTRDGAAAPERVLVLIAGGPNTQNRFTTQSGLIDARTALACRTIRSAGIRIHAIRLVDGDERLLADCAGPAGAYQTVRAPDGLTRALRRVASELGQVRMAR